MAVLAAAAMKSAAPRANAAGLLIADGGFGGVLEIKEHKVDVSINNGIAVTKVVQIFQNTENRQVEALYTFPVPKGASVANFSMWINGREMVGEVVEKERAREIYNSYKQKRRDPGLLEQVDFKTFEMRIFPIAAHAEQKVEITYYQELDVDHDWITYVYPLSTVTRKDIDAKTTGTFSIQAHVRSAVPITDAESPSHGDEFVIARHGDDCIQASLETEGGRLDRDAVLAFHLSRPRTGIDVITSREQGEDGYFYLTLTAGEDLSRLDTGMDYVFVMDISGSMGSDRKLITSKASVEAFIDALGEKDRFDVITFNVQPNTHFNELRAADEAHRRSAVDFMKSQAARGGTSLNPALRTAYAYSHPDRVLNVVVLSDGLTEPGDRQTLLKLISERPRNARVFCIGIGNEVNRPLLEQMAQDSGGLAAFVSRGDDYTRQAAAFRRKLMRPAVSDLNIQFGGARVYDVTPTVLPSLYHGSPVRVYGRYASGDNLSIDVEGNVSGVAIRKQADVALPKTNDDNPEIERMWAWRRIDELLKQADRAGSRKPVLDEVIALGEMYSIVTEYTSFLVLENDAEYRRWKIDRRNEKRMKRDRDAHAQRQQALDALKQRAQNGLGPQPAKPASSATAPRQAAPSARNTPAASPGASSPAPRRSTGFDLDMGTGPVGPLFLGLLVWLNRKKRKAM